MCQQQLVATVTASAKPHLPQSSLHQGLTLPGVSRGEPWAHPGVTWRSRPCVQVRIVLPGTDSTSHISRQHPSPRCTQGTPLNTILCSYRLGRKKSTHENASDPNRNLPMEVKKDSKKDKDKPAKQMQTVKLSLLMTSCYKYSPTFLSFNKGYSKSPVKIPASKHSF